MLYIEKHKKVMLVTDWNPAFCKETWHVNSLPFPQGLCNKVQINPILLTLFWSTRLLRWADFDLTWITMLGICINLRLILCSEKGNSVFVPDPLRCWAPSTPLELYLVGRALNEEFWTSLNMTLQLHFFKVTFKMLPRSILCPCSVY